MGQGRNDNDHSFETSGHSSALSAQGWETVFRTAQTPLFVEDVSLVMAAIDEVLASGTEDFPTWINAHPEFIIATIQNTKILDANDLAIEMAGAKSKEELLHSLERMIVPETLESFKEILIAIAAGEDIYQGESQYCALDGRIFYTMNRAILPKKKADGTYDPMVLATHDTTDLRLAREELQATAGRYQVVVETATDIIICHDLEGRILFTNQAGVDISGWTRKELEMANIRDFIPERLQPMVDELQKMRNQGFSGTNIFEIPVLHHDGREMPMEIKTSLIPGGLDQTPQLLSVMRDISNRKAMENRAISYHKSESLGELAGGIAHDFNNLLATIMGNAELMKSDPRKGPELDDFLDSILEASNEAADLCQQMLSYSGKSNIQLEMGDLSLVVEDFSRLMRASVGGQAKLTCHLAKNISPVLVAPSPLGQVVMALVSNATEALGDESGEILVSTGEAFFSEKDLQAGHCNPLLEAGSYVFCEVSDTGSGINASTMLMIFDPFFSTKSKGRGLGLSAALGIIQGHQGGFLINSIVGGGSKISFLLPKAPIKPQKARKPRRKKAPDTLHLDLAGKLILVVDEDVQVRKVCESFLRRLGCSVLSVGNGPDAVRLFSQRFDEVDVAILDLSMAGMDGIATYRRLRIIQADLPVIFSTGFSEDELDKRAGSFDEYGYIAKPFKLINIRQAVGQALRRTSG